MVGLHAEALKKMDLSHWWQQHIFVIKGRLRSGQALSSTITVVL
jgi:hypothetical protein